MFSGSSGSPDLRFEMTTADFHACAKQFDANEELIRLLMTGRVAGNLSLRDRPLEKLWGGEGNFRAAGIFFRYQIPCMNFFLGYYMNIC